MWGINYSPELTGIAPYNVALCEFLQQQGHEVRMVTTFFYYPMWEKLPRERYTLYRKDVLESVKVFRCWHYVPKKVSSLKRILHEGSFVFTSFLRQLFLKRPDVFVVVSPPLLLGAACWVLSWFKRAPFVFHVQDLQPDAAAGLGLLTNRGLIGCLYRLESLAYRKAAAVGGITRGMLSAFESKMVPAAKRVYFPNGVQLPNLDRLPGRGGFRRSNGYSDDDILIVYSGNLGAKQGLEVLIEAARFIKDSRVKFIICGEGNRRAFLEELKTSLCLANVRFFPLQPEIHYHELLVDADICVITQQKGSSNFFFPSKLLNTLAFAKAVLTVSDNSSELAQALRQGGFGKNVEPSNPGELARIIETMVSDPKLLSDFGFQGRRFVEQFEMRTVLEEFHKVIQKIARRRIDG